jgi:DNA-binding winged helix-turn-helix (wHTH) protein
VEQRYRFGQIELLCAERRILVAGEPVGLGARAFDVLQVLIENRERAVTHDELLDRVWRGRVVEDANVQVQVSAIRKLIGRHVVATIPGYGYRFAAVLDEAPQLAPASGMNRVGIDLADLPLPDKPP